MKANYAESAKKYSLKTSIDSIIDVYKFMLKDKENTKGIIKIIIILMKNFIKEKEFHCSKKPKIKM